MAFFMSKIRQIHFTEKSEVEKLLRFHTLWLKLPCPFKNMINLRLSLTGVECGHKPEFEISRTKFQFRNCSICKDGYFVFRQGRWFI